MEKLVAVDNLTVNNTGIESSNKDVEEYGLATSLKLGSASLMAAGDLDTNKENDGTEILNRL